MIEFLSEYNVTFIVGTPLFFFVMGVTFRLLDTSAAIFLEHNILVTSSYVTTKEIRRELRVTEHSEIAKALKKTLIFRKLHDLCMFLTMLSGVFLIGYFFYELLFS